MQQHPIPQNVTQYQFRLVGDMTLKQFLELALGLVLAYLFFTSNLVFIFKWPLVILSILLGAGLAFFPIEDRPLDQWIINFVKAIYAPTKFIWQKTNKIPRLFLFAAHAPDIITTITKTIKAPTISPTQQAISDLSEGETAKISSLDSIFKTFPVPSPSTMNHEPSTISKPTISIRKLKPATAVSDMVIHQAVTKAPLPPKNQPSTVHEPLTNPTFTAPSAIARQSPGDGGTIPMSTPKNITLPASPKSPNLVTGVVVDQHDKLIENAIVQIVSGDGIPARAMKTNSLGQFYTSTPLSPGTYVVEVDIDGLTYAPKQIVVNNTTLSPIELRANN